VPGFQGASEEIFGKEVARPLPRLAADRGRLALHEEGPHHPGCAAQHAAGDEPADVRLRYDEFADQLLVTVGEDREERLEDQVANGCLWFKVEEKFGFSPPPERFRTFLGDMAWQKRFHPVRDYLERLQWDGVKRLNSWLFDFGGVSRREDGDYDRYVSAVGRLILVAGVAAHPPARRQVRRDAGADQRAAWNGKSMGLATLARRPEWFTDSVDLGMKDKEVIEQMRGKWIAEVPELRGRRNEVDRIKAFLSRSTTAPGLPTGTSERRWARSFILFAHRQRRGS